MIGFALGIAVGLFVAWNVWDQPEWMQNMFSQWNK